MAFAYGEQLQVSGIHWLTYWINEYGKGNIKIHVGRNNERYARTSQEAYDNMLTLYTILSDEKTATYYAYSPGGGLAYCRDLVCGTPAAIRDFIMKSKMRPASGGSGSSFPNACGSDAHGTTAICGQGGIDINKVKAKTCLMTNIAGLMGVIEVVSGYNPFYHTQEYIDLQGYYIYDGDKYYNMDPTATEAYSKTDRYGAAHYSLSNVVWTPYTYCNYYTNGLSNTNMGTEAEMRNCKYGLLGLLMPYSCSCYSYGRKFNPQNNPNYVMMTDGDPINFIEQVLYDICGMIDYDLAWSTNSSDFLYYLPFGLSNGNITQTRTDYVKYNGNNAHLFNYNNKIFNNRFQYNWNHWNGQYTKREFSNIVCGNRDLVAYNMRTGNDDYYQARYNYTGGYIEALLVDPPWGNKLNSLYDYQYLPWWATGTRNRPEAAAEQLINSIDTWGNGFWTPEKKQQAKEAARYWYDRFGGPSDDEGLTFQGKTNYNYTIMNI